MASPQQALQDAWAQIGRMNRSQQIAILLGGMLVAGSIAWLVQWAASPEMTPLIEQPLSSEELARVTSGLEAINQRYRIVGSQVFVPRSVERSSVIAALHQADRMPTDVSVGFSALVKESNPWLGQAENNRRWTVALQQELAQVLRGFEGVRDATVFLNLNSQKQGFSRYQPESSASVTLTMKGGVAAPRGVALSAARLVSGAVRGLPLRNVQVVDSSGAQFDWSEEGDTGAVGIARQRRDEEKRRAAGIRQQLDYIAGLKVNVQVVLSHTSMQRASEEVSEGAATRVNTTEEETRRAARSGQPGVQPNTGEAVSAGGEGEFTVRSSNDQTLLPSKTATTEVTPAGQVQEVFASINVPRGYLLGIFRQAQPGQADEPSEDQLEEVFTRQRERIVRQVAKLVYPTEPEQIAVDWYYDGLDAPPVVEAGAVTQGFELAGRFGAPAALGALALLAMFITLRMARQAPNGEAFGLELGLTPEQLAAARKAREDARMAGAEIKTTVDENLVPQGMSPDALIEAQEVDEDMVQVDNMIQQVAKFVSQDEEGVAGLLERWLNDPR